MPPGSGDDVFLGLVQRVVAPIARAFRPGLIVVSAGYDAHADDPLANCEVTTAGYAELAATMRDLGAELGAPVLVCLEGGYDPDALAASVLATVRALGDGAAPRDADPAAAEPLLAHLDGGRWAPALSA